MKGQTEKARGILTRLTNENERSRFSPRSRFFVARQRKLLAFGGLVVFVGIMLSVFQQLVGIMRCCTTDR